MNTIVPDLDLVAELQLALRVADAADQFTLPHFVERDFTVKTGSGRIELINKQGRLGGGISNADRQTGNKNRSDKTHLGTSQFARL